MLEYTQTTIESVAKSIHRRITSSPWHEHLRINASRPNFGDTQHPHKRRKKYQGTSRENVAPPGENMNDEKPPNSINPLDNEYYTLQIIIPRQLRSTFEFVDFGREDGRNFQDIINGYSVDKHGPFLETKLAMC